MNAFIFHIEGNWAHFKKPETNNNPLTYDLIPKTAFVGLMGAVLGIERAEMNECFPVLCDDLLYGVQMLNPMKKVPWGYTSKSAFEPYSKGTPKSFEFLKNPKFRVLVALKNDRSFKKFEAFNFSLQNGESIFQPVLGWHNCPADLAFESEGELSGKHTGVFKTQSFVSSEHGVKILGTDTFRIGFDRIPFYQKDFWNFKTDEGVEAYQKIVYPDAGHEILVEGDYFTYSKGGNWWLI